MPRSPPSAWVTPDQLDLSLRLQVMIDALTLLDQDGTDQAITPSAFIDALFEATSYESDDITTEPNSPIIDGAAAVPAAAVPVPAAAVPAAAVPAAAPVAVPAVAPVAVPAVTVAPVVAAVPTGPNLAAAAATIPGFAASVAAATAPAAHPVAALLPPGDHVDHATGVAYYIPPVSAAVSRWYSVTRGRRVGVFQNWATVAPYVVGAAGVCYAKFNNRDDAVMGFANALAAHQVVVG